MTGKNSFGPKCHGCVFFVVKVISSTVGFDDSNSSNGNSNSDSSDIVAVMIAVATVVT